MPGQLGARLPRCWSQADLSATGFAKSEKEEDRHCRGDAPFGRAIVASHAQGRTGIGSSLVVEEFVLKDEHRIETVSTDINGDAIDQALLELASRIRV